MPKSRKRKPSQPKRNAEPKWEGFEKLVAAIHKAETEGAIVTWNEKIDGRQFDVTIRFKTGFYDYLTFIECKDCGTLVSVDKVEAFATKAKRYNANKSIMVSARGFQSGAIKAAKELNIQLFSLKQIDKQSYEWLMDDLLLFNQLDSE